MDDQLRALTTTVERFRAMRDDYARECKGGRTILLVDTCDILKYIHTEERKGLFYSQRAAKRLFENETHKRVLLAPHAYELLRFVLQLAKEIEHWSFGEQLQGEYMSPVTEFLEACDQGKWDKSAELWKHGVWRASIELAKAASYAKIAGGHNPFRSLVKLLDKNIVTPIDAIGIPLKDVNAVVGDDEAVRRALREFASMDDRAEKTINNMVDARAFGITVDLNQRLASESCHFTLTTLSPASLTAYARSLPDRASSICRNTIVSAYRKNLLDFEDVCPRQLEYMTRGVKLLETTITRYDPFMNATASLRDGESIPNGVASETLRFTADYMDYYNLYFKKLIEPVSVAREPHGNIDELQEAHELLDNGEKFTESLRVAHARILSHARELEPKLRPFVMGSAGTKKGRILIGTKSLPEMFDDMVRAIRG